MKFICQELHFLKLVALVARYRNAILEHAQEPTLITRQPL
jgi:hypothetical protein